jgi:hypothetical protein
MAYNYSTLNKTELSFLVDRFSALAKGNQKGDLIAALEERNPSEQDVKDALKKRREDIEKMDPNHKEPAFLRNDDVLLIRMRRQNPRFDFRSYTFTQEHPFVLMPTADAQALMQFEKGFLIATPQEAREYYGRN